MSSNVDNTQLDSEAMDQKSVSFSCRRASLAATTASSNSERPRANLATRTFFWAHGHIGHSFTNFSQSQSDLSSPGLRLEKDGLTVAALWAGVVLGAWQRGVMHHV